MCLRLIVWEFRALVLVLGCLRMNFEIFYRLYKLRRVIEFSEVLVFLFVEIRNNDLIYSIYKILNEREYVWYLIYVWYIVGIINRGNLLFVCLFVYVYSLEYLFVCFFRLVFYMFVLFLLVSL